MLTMKTKLALCLLLAVLFTSNAVASFSPQPAALAFIENKGQITDQGGNPRNDVQYKVSTPTGLNIFIGNGNIHYQFFHKRAGALHSGDKLNKSNLYNDNAGYDMYRMDMELLGADQHARVVAENPQAYYENYITAATKGTLVTAHSCQKITYTNVYPNIDWVLYIRDGHLEHEFVVRTGGRVSDIRCVYHGAGSIHIEENGGLATVTPMGVISEQAPVSHQSGGGAVSTRFQLRHDTLSYVIAQPYSGTLTIDPVLKWATYYGDSGDDACGDVTTDHDTKVYVTGGTNSAANIATTGSFQAYYQGGGDGFIVRFTPSGARVWGTYYGASGAEAIGDAQVDQWGYLYVLGSSNSGYGMASPGAYQTTASNTFLAKFDSTGTRIWSTYFGGPYSQTGYGLALSSSGSVYITGSTVNTTGVATPGAFQTTNVGYSDAFLARFDSSGTLRWATYYGGANGASGTAIATDDSEHVYIAGSTSSTDSIVTAGTYRDTLYSRTNVDGFLVKFDSAGHRLWGTYYGGEAEDDVNGIAIGPSSSIYMTGFTKSIHGIASPGCHQSRPGTGFLAGFDRAGGLKWSTYYGGTVQTHPRDIATDLIGNLYIGGDTKDDSFIVSPDGRQWDQQGAVTNYAFLARFDTAGAFWYGTYYGGQGTTFIMGICEDGSSNVYAVGETDCDTMVATPGAFLDTLGQNQGQINNDGFVAKWNFCSDSAATIHQSGQMLSVTQQGAVQWYFNSNPIPGATQSSYTATQNGTYFATVSANGCEAQTHDITISALGVNDLPGNKIIIQPNPTTDILTVSGEGTYNITVFDMQGQKVMTASSANKISLSTLSAGIYIIGVNNYNGETILYQKIVKQ